MASALHITAQDARQGKSSEGEQDGKEELEEGEEDPTDQAVAEATLEVGLVFDVPGVPSTSAEHARSNFEMTKGLPPQGWQPFF